MSWGSWEGRGWGTVCLDIDEGTGGDLMTPGEILGGKCHRLCRVTLLGRWGMHYKERAIPGLFTREWYGAGVLGLACECVCVIVNSRCATPTLQLILWLQLQPRGAGRPIGIALLVFSHLLLGSCLCSLRNKQSCTAVYVPANAPAFKMI